MIPTTKNGQQEVGMINLSGFFVPSKIEMIQLHFLRIVNHCYPTKLFQLNKEFLYWLMVASINLTCLMIVVS